MVAAPPDDDFVKINTDTAIRSDMCKGGGGRGVARSAIGLLRV